MVIPESTEQRLQVSIEEAARLLSYSRSTVETLLRKGELRGVGSGRLRRISVEELRQWQRRNKG